MKLVQTMAITFAEYYEKNKGKKSPKTVYNKWYKEHGHKLLKKLCKPEEE